MTDPRTTPDPDFITEETPARINTPLVDLRRTASGPRDRQLLYGDRVTILTRKHGYILLRAKKDGYCGWVGEDVCGVDRAPSHRVAARSTHAYADASIKSPDQATLSFGAQVTALSESDLFVETDLGFVPKQHLKPADALESDPAEVAARFLGTPYLWGGNSGFGLDCSGLIQAACLSCGVSCPGDSDQQQDQLGTVLPSEAELERNDVIFWRGHVALVVDENRLIHANAGHMATVLEPIADAIARIEHQGDGRPTAFKRFL